MRFEGRDLKPYAVPATELEEGSVYFSVTFIDEDMRIPIVDTLVFIGRNLDRGDRGRVYFQDVESHAAGVRYGSTTEGDIAAFYKCAEDEATNVFEFENALDELLRCSLRRREAG